MSSTLIDRKSLLFVLASEQQPNIWRHIYTNRVHCMKDREREILFRQKSNFVVLW